MSRQSGFICCVLSFYGLIACQFESQKFPQAKLNLNLHLTPVDQSWLTQRQPVLTFKSSDGYHKRHHLSEMGDEVDDDTDEMTIELEGAWRGPFKVTLSYLTDPSV